MLSTVLKVSSKPLTKFSSYCDYTRTDSTDRIVRFFVCDNNNNDNNSQ